MRGCDWICHGVEFYKCFDDEGVKSIMRLGGWEGHPDDPVFEELLDALLVAAFSKRPDNTESASCRLYEFTDDEEGRSDRLMLEAVLDAGEHGVFGDCCRRLASRYSRLPRCREGVLIFVSAAVSDPVGRGSDFFVVFKCDFEDALRVEEDTGRLVVVDSTILRKLRKVAVYPWFDGREAHRNSVKIFQDSPSGYFSELFAVEPPPTVRELFHGRLEEALETRVESAERYHDYFEGEIPRERELFGQERYIRFEDLLPPEEAGHVGRMAAMEVREVCGKEPRVKLVVDGRMRFEADVSLLGSSFFLAKGDDGHYLVVRGERFVARGELTPAEFQDAPPLEELLQRLCNGGEGS